MAVEPGADLAAEVVRVEAQAVAPEEARAARLVNG